MSQRGVTLIEVVIVATIVLALSSVAMVSYQSYVKTAYQTEAQVNLANIRQLQKLYEAEEFKFQANLEILGFQPQGVLRYNIGAFWLDATDPDNHSIYNILPLNDICGLCDTNGDGEDDDIDNRDCCMENNKNRVFSSDPNIRCFGHKNGFFSIGWWQQSDCRNEVQVDYVYSEESSQERKFRYFAVGCVSSEIESADDLDIWSINQHAVLINHRATTQENPICH